MEMLLAFTTGGQGQICCWISYSAQDSPPQQKAIQPQMSVVPRLRNPALSQKGLILLAEFPWARGLIYFNLSFHV